jgi:hypothetical protein
MPTSFEIGIVPGFRLRLCSLDRFRSFDVAQTAGRNSSIPNPQQMFPLPKVALEAHALGDVEQPLANGNLVCYIYGRSDPPLETVPQFLASVAFFGVFVVSVWVFAAGVAAGSGKSESEDQAQYEHFNPPV